MTIIKDKQEPVDVSPGGMPCRVREWLVKEYEAFDGPRPWPYYVKAKFNEDLCLLIRFSESLQEKKEDKQ